jgi:hypothetical protein
MVIIAHLVGYAVIMAQHVVKRYITLKKVVIESPLSGDFARNIRYARLCALDCVRRGEAPYASHLLMTQFLDDCTSEERKAGMEVGFEWAQAGEVVAVYQDFGISAGMYMGIENAVSRGQKLEYRYLPQDLMDRIDRGTPTKTEGIDGTQEHDGPFLHRFSE